MDRKNTTTKTEFLSAFLDDEAGAFELRRMLDESQKDDELKQKVANYSLIGEVMRNDSSNVTVKADFLAGIHNKLDNEPVYHDVLINHDVANSSNVFTQPSSWLRPVAGMALVASLVAVTVVTLNMNNDSGVSTVAESTVVAQQSASKPTPVYLAKASTVPVTPSVSTALSTPDMAWRKRLRRYVNSHAKYASTSAIMPSIRAASYASSY